MQAVEALTLLIDTVDHYMVEEGGPADPDKAEGAKVAVAICQAMLNTALPVARFRCFVKIESGREEGREYTICAVNIEDIVAALYPLSTMARKVYVTLWEQRPTGADMIEAFQGWTRTAGVRKMHLFLDSLRQYASPAVN